MHGFVEMSKQMVQWALRGCVFMR